MISKAPEAVIFDMDGLLLDSEMIYGRVWTQAAQELGYASEPNDYHQYVGRRAEDCDEDIRASYGEEFPIARFWERQVILYNEHRSSFGIPVKVGAKELLTYLKKQNIPTAIATSTHREEALLSLGSLAEHFDVIVTGDEVRNGKPDPEIFLLAARRINTPAADCLVLEDAEAGVCAASAAGMSVIMVPDLKPCPEALAGHLSCVCSSLFEVKEIVSRAFEHVPTTLLRLRDSKEKSSIMKIYVPKDHGATDVVEEARDFAVVRPHKYEGDTYIPGWYYFQAVNDTGQQLPQASIIIEGLAPGVYEPYWNHSMWSRDGANWERIPESAKELSSTPESATLTIETSLNVDEACWITVIYPLTYAWYERLSDELTTPIEDPAIDWSIERRQIGESVEERPLYAFHIHRQENVAKRNLLIVAGQHAVEESGKMLAENVLRGYHSGQFRGTVMEELLQTHDVTVVPVANPDGCYHGRMNSNAEGIVIWLATDNSRETQAILKLIDELQPHVQINCHGWGNEIGVLPYEDIYRFTEEDPLFRYLKEHVPGCSSSGLPHLFTDQDGRIEWHAHQKYGTHCSVVEVNYHWYLPLDGSEARHPTREDINARIRQYLEAIAGFCLNDQTATSSVK